MQQEQITLKQIKASIADTPISRSEIRYMMDLYYQLQEFRKAGGNQERAAKASAEPEPAFAKLIHENLRKNEDAIKKWLGEAAQRFEVGRWTIGVTGIGPVIAAGLLAHIDIRKAPTVGHIWRFAGLDPTCQWIGSAKAEAIVKDALAGCKNLEAAIPAIADHIGRNPATLRKLATTDIDGKVIKLTKNSLARAAAKRPWNAKLKVLCFHIGECFVKTSNNETSVYGQIYRGRKMEEEARNEALAFQDQAKAGAARVGKSTEAYKHYVEGKLPPGHLHARAKRYAVKLFLSHWHWVAYRAEYGIDPPKPYVVEHLGHADLMKPPGVEW